MHFPKRYKQLAIAILLLAMFSSCSNTRFLAADESLFVGCEISIIDTNISRSTKKHYISLLHESLRPIPNKSFLGLKWKLYVYNIVGQPKKESGGLRNWLRNSVGVPPVLASKLNLEYNNKLIESQLQNLGYLRSHATANAIDKKKRTKAYYEVELNDQYKIKEIAFPADLKDDSQLAEDINAIKSNTLLKAGTPYNLTTIKNERIRIDDYLKNQGYYFFNPEYIMFQIDTGIGNNQIAINTQLKWDEMPSNAYEKYRINDVILLPNYRAPRTIDSTRSQRVAKMSDTLIIFNDIKMVDRTKTYRPMLFTQALQLKPGEIYNQKDNNLTLNRLVTMGTFKFVKNDIVQLRLPYVNQTDSSGIANYNTHSNNTDGLLNIIYYLTPYPKKSLSAELNGFTKNDSRAGSRGSISWRNRNTFRGGELLTIKLSGGFEMQYGSIKGATRRPNTFNAGLNFGLNIPRFLIPIITVKPSGTFVPRTLVNIDYNFIRRGNLYTIHSGTVGWGYNWKEDIKRDHKLYPINISLIRTDTIDKSANFDINLSNLVYNGVIIGSTYEYVFNSRGDGNSKKNNYYVSVLGDVAGNMIGLIEKTTKLQEEPKKIFGSRYAQYGKVQTDFRYYHQINPKLEVATRLILGIGLPYGNSKSMPNVKQFFSGGSNSLRGFPSRLVGPGTYNYRNGSYIEVLGDTKLEFNIELRQKLYRFIDLAAFLDAGNIWLLRDNPEFPGGKLTKNFLNELAVDVGLGLRFDFSILILRFDFAGPIRKPWLPEKERWQIGDINVGSPEWRKENLFFNLAIGLPF